MHPHAIVALVLEFTKALYDTAALSKELEAIRKSILEVYSDIADAHFRSAIQALDAVRRSTNPESEVRSCVAHLRDAYNIYYALLNKKTVRTVFLFFEKTEDTVWKKDRFFLICAKLAASIARIYAMLEERENASTWKELGIAAFDQFLAHLYFSTDELAEISGEYVYTYERPPTLRTGPSVGYSPTTVVDISSKGQQYIAGLKTQLRETFVAVVNKV